MKKRGITIATLAIAGVFIVTIIALGVCVYSDYKSGLKVAGAKFEKLSSRAAEASGIYASGSKEFLNLFNSAVGSPDIFDSISLEVNGKEAYKYPMNGASQTSAFVKTFSTRIVGGDGADIRLSAGIYTVPPAIIFYRAKIAFIAILAGTLAACVLLMYLYLGVSEKSEDDVNFKETDVKDDFGESLFDEEADTKEEAPADAATEQSEEPEQDGLEKETSEDEKVDYNPLENAYADQQAQMPEGQGEAQEDNDIPAPRGEQGLFSPTSGFGWESYLNARLESELVRAASSEHDLALAIIKIPGMTKESDYYGNICQSLLDFFQFKDFIFEYKEDAFAVIVQNKDIDQALQSAEVLHSNLLGTLTAAGEKTKPQIGISSRSLRLISAERLKNEAEQALLHAGEKEDSPIIAFRVDPDKYRKFIGGQTTEAAAETSAETTEE